MAMCRRWMALPLLTASEIETLLLGAAPESAALLARAGGTVEWVWDLSDVGTVSAARASATIAARVRCSASSPAGRSRRRSSVCRVKSRGSSAETEGLVLVSGPRANGKSTLISSLVDLINRTRRDYVITIESEVNVVHERQGAFVSQREVRGGSDEALAAARAALREDPDVLVIDDLKTSGLDERRARCGSERTTRHRRRPAHHASGAVERLIDLYQPEQRRQVQLALAQNLRGVVSQVLLRKSGGGRVAAREILLNTPIVSSLLAEGRMNQLPMAIEGGRKSGMVPLNDALVGFVQSGAVDVRDAYRRAADRAGLLDLLKRQGIDTSVVERLGAEPLTFALRPTARDGAGRLVDCGLPFDERLQFLQQERQHVVFGDVLSRGIAEPDDPTRARAGPRCGACARRPRDPRRRHPATARCSRRPSAPMRGARRRSACGP